MKEHAQGRGEQDAPPPPSSIDTASLDEKLRARFEDVTSVRVVPIDGCPSAFLGVVHVKTRSPGLAERLVDAAAEHGVLLYPALFSAQDGAALDRAFGSSRWSELGAPDGALRQVDRLRGAGYPRSVRRWLSRAIQRHRALLDHVRRSEQLPLYASLTLCAMAVEDSLRLLFATAGERFLCGPQAAARFDELFVKPGHFATADGRVAAELRGAAQQAAVFAELCPGRSFEWLDAVRRASAFFDRFERYVARVFVSAAERRRHRQLTLAGCAAGGLAVVVALAFWLITSRPLAPLPAAPRFSLAGGIAARYFNGRVFEKHVLSRTDPRILFSTMGSPVAGVTPDNFSIRWDGFLFFAEPGKYLLCSECDDGARVFFNGAPLIDDWKIHGLNRTCAPVRVKQGWYPLKVEYFEVSKSATMRLLRGPEEDALTVVPSEHLCCREPPPAKPLAKAAARVRALPLPSKALPPPARAPAAKAAPAKAAPAAPRTR